MAYVCALISALIWFLIWYLVLSLVYAFRCSLVLLSSSISWLNFMIVLNGSILLDPPGFCRDPPGFEAGPGLSALHEFA